MAAMALLEQEGLQLTRMAVDLALAGDTTALRLCLERLVPPRKTAPVVVDLPELETTKDLVQATKSLVAATSQGDLLPGDANELGRLLETHRRAIETEELEDRIAALEEELAKGRQ